MTAMLGCDGCGNIVQDRGEDEAISWMELSFGPVIGGGLLPDMSFNFETDQDDEP